MKDVVFNTKLFWRTIIIFLFSTIVWTFLCIKTNHFTDRDKGFVTGLGFLLLFSNSIFFGQKLTDISTYFFLTFLTIVTYLVSSFVLTFVALFFDSLIFYSIINSLFVSIVMTYFLNKKIKIEFIKETILSTFFSLLLAYIIVFNLQDKIDIYLNIDKILTVFNIFQLALIIPLTLGLTRKKPAANSGLALLG